jgi:hypothetical protein
LFLLVRELLLFLTPIRSSPNGKLSGGCQEARDPYDF